MNKLAVFSMLFFFVAATASAQIYKWVDADGKLYFSDQPMESSAEKVSVFDSDGGKGEPARRVQSSDPLKKRQKDLKEDLATDLVANSIISSGVNGLNGSTIIPLENGQVWRQSSYSYFPGPLSGRRAKVYLFKSKEFKGLTQMHVEGLGAPFFVEKVGLDDGRM